MLSDAGTLAESGLLEADVCIVGSGPAGTTIAKELSRAGLRVIILESGEKKPTAAGSELNRGTVDSPQGYPENVLEEGRRRQLGGSANLWNHEPRGQAEKFIRCVPLDAVDFEKRDWMPHSGWPFSRKELEPFYERAQKAFGIGRFDYSSSGWRGGDTRRKPLETPALESSVSQFGLPKHFLKDAADDLLRSENVRVLLRTNLLSLERDSLTNQIVSAHAADETGRKLCVKATYFVLAAGGLENPRILLLNQAAQPGGLGNQNDMVGRCFMDHPSITLGTLTPSSAEFFEQAAFYDQQVINGQPVMGKLHLRPEVMRREKLLNLYSILVPRFRNIRSNVPLIVKELLIKGPQFLSRQRVGNRGCVTSGQPMEAAPSFRQRLLEGYFSECYCGWSNLENKAGRFGEFGVRALVELAPDPANRVMLGDEVDALGQKKMKIVWRWTEADLRSIRRTQEIFQSEFATAGVGKFVPVAEGHPDCPRSFFSTHHFMGATRMHEDPKQGVVDANCQLHGTENLFVAGSSVFPTGGCANPTLTLVALAFRLADHLKSKASGVVAETVSERLARSVLA
ncbi:MAG TPA: GMC family oxidoreductase [Chthoniobacterales bacterium]|jgi:choline dehydrogenase-like flavoprotein